jgi:hypothetical protein
MLDLKKMSFFGMAYCVSWHYTITGKVAKLDTFIKDRINGKMESKAVTPAIKECLWD